MSSKDTSPESSDMSANTFDHPTTSPVDVFILTFNAAKQKINPRAFAWHLRHAFAQGADGLPELVVICLQEMAPLANSFIGSYMINPFFEAYVSAIHIAAGPLLVPGSRYTHVITRHVGMTGIMLFALDPSALSEVTPAEVSFGAGDMANKGAVGLRMLYFKQDDTNRTRHTELTFVSTHLAPHEWNLEKRNKNWETIVSGLVFDDPHQLRCKNTTHPTTRPYQDRSEERAALLPVNQSKKALHDITVYKPGSHLFVAGDLNYRISKTPPDKASLAVYPHIDPDHAHYWEKYLRLDQLTLEKAAGRTLHGLIESAIKFPPSYKLDVSDKQTANDEEIQSLPSGAVLDEVAWTWNKKRWPGWCDRVLYLDIPSWVSSSKASASSKAIRIDTIAYNVMPPVRTSDHRAVFLRLGVPVLEPSALAPSEHSLTTLRTTERDNPRVRLPYPVDLDTRENRARFKKWEYIIGWSMLILESKSVIVFSTLAVAGIVATWGLRSI
ncbi:Endonuclease/exonuclease/phosphatase [Astrocystis sublimbata]|nr:Endonuclease/exonuclease/phosphatase [Astrocystis sublimbata]